ncbi:MAG: TMEM175 family protein [Vulcanimicrobiaceae bacterium]|jgi:uncharacterized membrane protein
MTKYNIIAGQSLDRLAALSDGLFSVAMTLLVLDIRVPPLESVHSEQDLWRALGVLAPRLIPYAMTFLTLGIFWVGQQTQLTYFERGDRNLAWISIAFLLTVSLTPFSTALLAQFITYRTALVVYWLNILLLGVGVWCTWQYAVHAGLLKNDTPPQVHKAIKRRIYVAQALYAFGALLCVINTYWSIAFIVLCQLNYAVAPKIRLLYRL